MTHIIFLKVVLLAAVSDGEIQPPELEMIDKLKKNHPALKEITDLNIQEAIADIFNKISAGMDVKYIIQDLGDQLNEREQHAAYALAKEVVSSDFILEQNEKDFIGELEERWNIPSKIIEAINISIQLRYFNS